MPQVAPFFVRKSQVVHFFVVTWPPNLSSSDIFKEIAGPDFDEKVAPNIIDKYKCKHRMACARCPFYRPKESLADQLLEGQANLLRMLEFVQLTEEEKLLVTEGIELHQALIEQLANTPTPTGLTPREMETLPVGETAVIPVKTVRRKERKTRGE